MPVSLLLKQSLIKHRRVDENKFHRRAKTPCNFCQETEHHLYAFSKFTEMLLADQSNYAKEQKLCYSCLKAGHSVRDCRYRHFCDICR